MTSAEKVAELRQAIAAAVAGLDRESELGEQLFATLGLWASVPGFIRRKLAGIARESLPVELLENADALDDVLGLLAGVALELRTDTLVDARQLDEGYFGVYRERARELLGQVRGLAA